MSPRTGPDQARTANTEGERALAGGELPAAERAFTAALACLDQDGPGHDGPGHDGEIQDGAVQDGAIQDGQTAGLAAAAHLGLGRVCLARNDLRAADLRFDRVQRLSPAEPDGYYWGGCVAAHHASFHRAEWLFGAALDRNTALGKAYLQRAFVRLKLGRHEPALADLRAAAGHGCLTENGRLLTAALLARGGDWSGAESVLVQAGPDRPEAAVVQGIARFRRDQVEAALAEYERAVAGGLRDAAADSWDVLRDFYPQHEPLIRFGLVLRSLSRGRPAEAELRDLAAGITTPEHIRRSATRILAALLVRRGDRISAMDLLDGIADNDVHDERAHRDLVLLLTDASLAAAQQNDWATAASLLRSRDGLQPGEPNLVEALVHGFAGDRSRAVDLLGKARARQPTDHRIGHAQAVMQLHVLSSGTTPPPNVSWHSCVGAWVSVLYDEAFWDRWPRQAEQRYGRAVPTAVIDSARTALRDFAEDRLPTNDLALLLRREYEAARALGRAGGLPTGEPAPARLVSGPLRIAELGLQRRLGEFLLKIPAADGDVESMRRQFSQLGIAEVHLAAGRPREATRAALDLRCPACEQSAGAAYPAMISEPLLCEPDCAQFDLLNPAFSALDGKHDQLSRSSAALAAGTLLGIARSDITSGEMDLADARKCWRQAIRLAQGFGRHDEVLREAVGDALGRAKTLDSRRDWTDAIAVLEAVLIVIPARDTAERDRVTHVLSGLLNTRGVHDFNERRANEQAHADLSRAVELSPHMKGPRLNLGVVVRDMAYVALESGDLTGGIGLLRQAIDHFEAGLATRPGDREFQGELDGTRADLDIALGRAPGPPQPGKW